MAVAKEEKRDETPTRLKHDGGGIVVVPAYKAEGLLRGGSFTKAPAKSASSRSAEK